MSKLSDFAYFVNDKISNEYLSADNYVGVDNLIANRGGVKISNYLPIYGSSIRFRKNDILIGNIRPYFKKIWLATFDGGCSGDVLCIRSKQKETAQYLYACLSQDSFFDYDMAGAKGSKMPRGDKKHIMNFPFNLIKEYTKIGKLIVELETQIKRNEEMVQKLQYFKPALNFSMNGGITHVG